MQRFYSKLVRKSYRTLRHKRIRKVSWLNRIVLKLFKRDLWRPCVRTVALGLSLGLFCAMLPMPMQMILAASLCLIFRANIPIAIAACWVSNPITQVPLMLCQEGLGDKIRETLHLGWLEFMSKQGTIPFLDRPVNLANYAVGVGASAIALAILAFPAVYLFYALVPKKYLQHKVAKAFKRDQIIKDIPIVDNEILEREKIEAEFEARAIEAERQLQAEAEKVTAEINREIKP